MFGIKEYQPGVGTMIKGWDISEEHFRDPQKFPIVDLAVMTNACPRDCGFCFTDKNEKTLTLGQIKNLLDQLAEKNTYAVQYVGEGEPTLDKDFFEIIEYTTKKGIIPLVYTKAALKLTRLDFVKRLFDSGTSVLPKCDSLFNAEYQNRIVESKIKKSTYFDDRNKAIENLIQLGFNKINPDGTTRMGFDMILSEENYNEVEQMLHYCRRNNLYVMFAFHLTAGRTIKTANHEVKKRKELLDLVEKIDLSYGIKRGRFNNFLTGPCKEYLMVRGDGRVQPCPGNEHVLGYIQKKSISEIEQILLEKYPCHDRATYLGNCPYRPSF
ncbi:MAG TPA: radical SAM protein [Candidatus Paceibacterota bacterium]